MHESGRLKILCNVFALCRQKSRSILQLKRFSKRNNCGDGFRESQVEADEAGEVVACAPVQNYLPLGQRTFGERCIKKHGKTAAQPGKRIMLFGKHLKSSVPVSSLYWPTLDVSPQLFGLRVTVGEHML